MNDYWWLSRRLSYRSLDRKQKTSGRIIHEWVKVAREKIRLFNYFFYDLFAVVKPNVVRKYFFSRVSEWKFRWWKKMLREALIRFKEIKALDLCFIGRRRHAKDLKSSCDLRSLSFFHFAAFQYFRENIFFYNSTSAVRRVV